MPAIAPTHARLRWSSSGSSCNPASNHSRARSASKRDERTHCVARTGHVRRASEPLDVLGREVDPTHAAVLDDVAQDVGELERDTEIVGKLDGRRDPGLRRGGRAEDAERQAPDRARNLAAVVDELVVGLVGRARGVE